MAQAFPASRFTGYDFSADGHCRRSSGGGTAGHWRTRASWSRTWRAWTWNDAVRFHHRLRRHPRPGPAASGACGTSPERCARRRRFLAVDVQASSNLRGEPGPPAWPVDVRDQHDALHDRVAGPRRRGTGRRVGRAEGARAASPRRAWSCRTSSTSRATSSTTTTSAPSPRPGPGCRPASLDAVRPTTLKQLALLNSTATRSWSAKCGTATFRCWHTGSAEPAHSPSPTASSGAPKRCVLNRRRPDVSRTTPQRRR